MTDSVFVRGLEFEANHGYTAAERRATRRFRLDIEVRTALDAAARSDRLGDTIDYRKICEVAMAAATGATYRLLEALAAAVGTAIAAEFAGVEVIVELEKLAPPCPGVPAACGVRIRVEPSAQ